MPGGMEEDQGQQPFGLTDHFADGAQGTMRATSPATAQPPQVPQVDPAFHGGSPLEIPNTIKPVNGVSDKSYLQANMPYGQANSPLQQAQAGEAQDQSELGEQPK
jgi:hypothetical protein